MAVTTTASSEYDQITNTIISAARFTEEATTVMKGLVTNFTMPKGASTYRVPRFSTVSAAALTEGIALTASQNLTVSKVDCTTDEAGLKCIITDKLMRECTEDVYRAAGKVMGDAIGRYIDEQLLALLDGFSTNTLGNTTKLMDEEVLIGAVGILEGNKATRPYYCVHHPYAYHHFVKSVAVAALSYAFPSDSPNKMIKDHYFKTLAMYTVDLYKDANLTIDSSDDAKGAMFSKEALCITTSLAPTVEKARDMDLRALGILEVVDFGVNELMDAYGVELYFAAAKPAPTGD